MKINKIYLLLFTVMLTISCEDFVTIEVPYTQLSSDLVFDDVRTADAVLVTVYSKMQATTLVTGDSGGLSVLLGNYTDEIICHNSNIPELLFYQNNLLATNSTIQALWRNTYNLIYIANKVVEGVENSKSIAEPDRDRLVGEALFVRAYLHFYLNQLFGEIPYVKTTDYRINSTVEKHKDAAIFLFLQEDLLRAESLLTSNYTGANRIRPNKSTVIALQARMYLYQKKWKLAEQKSTLLINTTQLYSLASNLNDVFLHNSSGTIWQLMSAPEGKNTLDAKSFTFTSAPPPSRALNDGLVYEFEPHDLRRINWIKKISNGSVTFYHPFKYKYNNDTSTSMEHSILFRLEEMYLIRAEANAELNLPDLSAADLNIIRKRAGLENISSQSKDELINAILKERQLEFFTELGHRFFDLKRRGLLDSVLTGIKPGWKSSNALFPLPENELLVNPSLSPQNEGY